jgi:predicted ATP-dependent endonuclease of OLD family
LKFSRLFIKNFRSVSNDGLEIRFTSDCNLSAIVGANGSGKTNVLEALARVLGVYPFSRLLPEEQDFWNKDTDNDLLIELDLDPPLVDRDVYQKEYEIFGLRYRAWRRMRGDGKGILSHEHYCLDKNRKTIVKPRRIFKKTQREAETIDNSQLPVIATDQAWKLGEAFYVDAPSLERFFDRTSGWSPMGRLFDIYRDDFSAAHNTYTDSGGRSMPSRDALERLSRHLTAVLKTQKLKDIENNLSEKFRGYLGTTVTHQPLSVEFALPSHRELFDKAIALHVSDRVSGPTLPIDSLGSGYRALLRLAVIETLLDMDESKGQYLLLIEEPEIYLHVHLQRHFSRLIRHIAARGNQIIFSTHASTFVNLESPHEIARLSKTVEGATTARQASPDFVFDFQKAKRKVRRSGSEELFFADHVVLTEGQDDQGVWEILLRAAGVDIDANSISVVDCNSANNLSDYIRLCSAFGIDWYAIHDEDDPVKNIKRNKGIKDAAEAAKPKYPSLHTYKPDLETTIGERKHCGLDRLLAKLNEKSYEAIRKAFGNLVLPVDEFISTRNLLS